MNVQCIYICELTHPRCRGNAKFMLDDGMAYMEQFASTDLVSLRDELFQSGLDSWQVAELVGSFLAAHGYGVSHDDVRSAALSLQFLHGSIQEMQAELERLALPM